MMKIVMKLLVSVLYANIGATFFIGCRVLQELWAARRLKLHRRGLGSLLRQIQIQEIANGLLANSVKHSLVHAVALTLVFH